METSVCLFSVEASGLSRGHFPPVKRGHCIDLRDTGRVSGTLTWITVSSVAGMKRRGHLPLLPFQGMVTVSRVRRA